MYTSAYNMLKGIYDYHIKMGGGVGESMHSGQVQYHTVARKMDV